MIPVVHVDSTRFASYELSLVILRRAREIMSGESARGNVQPSNKVLPRLPIRPPASFVLMLSCSSPVQSTISRQLRFEFCIAVLTSTELLFRGEFWKLSSRSEGFGKDGS